MPGSGQGMEPELSCSNGNDRPKLPRRERGQAFDDLDKKIEKVSGILSKIMWLFVSAMILGFVAFISNGGLRVP